MLGEFVAKNPADQRIADYINLLCDGIEKDNEAAILQATTYAIIGIPFSTTLEHENGKIVMKVCRLDDPPHSATSAELVLNRIEVKDE